MYGTPAPSAESKQPEAWLASIYGHFRESADVRESADFLSHQISTSIFYKEDTFFKNIFFSWLTEYQIVCIRFKVSTAHPIPAAV